MRPLVPASAVVIAALLFPSSSPAALAQSPAPGAREQVARQMLGLPLHFEPNMGQTAPCFDYLARGAGYWVGLGGSEATIYLSRKRPADPVARNRTRFAQKDDIVASSVVTLRFAGACSRPKFQPEEPMESKSNYLLGNDPKHWRVGVPHFGRVRRAGLYPGIDAVFYGNQRELEYDFEVAPGADPGNIRLEVLGADALKLREDGGLDLLVPGGAVLMRKPELYQRAPSGGRVAVEGRYVVDAGNRVRFEVGGYDRGLPLVIDPVLSYGTYLGGSGTDEIYAMTTDSSGRIYVTGATTGSFPTTTGAYKTTYQGGDSDVFVTKINPNTSGTAGRVYSTYIGGSFADEGLGIAVDSTGAAYVCGDTYSSNFPKTTLLGTTGGADVFVLKLNATGTALTYSTRIGGSFDEFPSNLSLDASKNAYVTGATASSAFPTKNAFQSLYGGSVDAFVLSLNSTGTSLNWSTFLGGTNYDEGVGITQNGTGYVYVVGDTSSTNLPRTNDALQFGYGGGFSDSFVSVISSNGSKLSYSTFLGGNCPMPGGDGRDVATAVALDAFGNIVVTGYTSACDFPTRNALQSVHFGGIYDAFLSKLTASGSGLIFSTYWGGSGEDLGLALGLDPAGNPVIAGSTFSIDFPTLNGFEDSYQGAGDAFASKFSSGGTSLIYSTHVGGGSQDVAYALAVAGGDAYVGGYRIHGLPHFGRGVLQQAGRHARRVHRAPLAQRGDLAGQHFPHKRGLEQLRFQHAGIRAVLVRRHQHGLAGHHHGRPRTLPRRRGHRRIQRVAALFGRGRRPRRPGEVLCVHGRADQSFASEHDPEHAAPAGHAFRHDLDARGAEPHEPGHGQPDTVARTPSVQ